MQLVKEEGCYMALGWRRMANFEGERKRKWKKLQLVVEEDCARVENNAKMNGVRKGGVKKMQPVKEQL